MTETLIERLTSGNEPSTFALRQEAASALTVAQARIERPERGLTSTVADFDECAAAVAGIVDGEAAAAIRKMADTARSVLFPDQEGETPETCPAERGEWCPDPACLAKCKHVPPSPTTEETKAEEFIQAAIDRAPEPLRRLGEFLSRVLDEDQWATAEPMLLALSPSTTEERLRQALRPFALVASAVDNGTLFSGAPRIDDAEPVATGGQGETWFTMGDLRKARAALSSDRQTEDRP